MKRCEHCKHWVDTVFKGQSASGWGVWYGDCHNPQVPHSRDRHSLMVACGRFDEGAHPHSLQAAMNRQSEARAAAEMKGNPSPTEPMTAERK